ncbi:rod shape-determining protein RodA [Clostridium botulinum]|uniref:Cell division protein FtsW n=1 Tax=Clostridium botulinum TaxID=1491 RepID=A0A9Q1UYK2_CLOBO|nr:rod shape-determining protein RodA [Clostridium botulinum]AEB75561.1 rod shape-determining protein RodA [Clostridium botulinum BKT015925]KEH99570.1 cell division protein FtsW [Clostridium botulinum D str. 16868]KEI03502.1 cell division protein FtsW [Clostridium botulinum C/D str. Sp77]KLU75248.1 cell division protein FtsW [Clostridium botulinum V891]KOA73748.1 cell division protein FtsW [Clostridium botulinum]
MLEKFKISKKLLRQLDFGVIITCVIIVLFSCVNIYSATFRNVGIYYAKLQFIWMIIGALVVYGILLVDYVIIGNYASIIYWAGIVLLLLNDFVLGSTHKGAKGWIGIGSRAIQPSEFAKLGMIIMLAKLWDDIDGKINEPKNFFRLAFYAVLPMTLIVIQPDMGMTMVTFFIALGIFFIGGLDLKVILGGLLSIFVVIVGVWNSPLMPAYWKGRLSSFINPEAHVQGMGFQLKQSLMGIGSGNILGEGFKKGLQVSGNNIPEAHTDFIFAVVGEEWGLIGAIFLLCLYGFLIYKFIKIAKNSKDIFGTIIAVGVISTFLFSIFQNIGMTIGLMPITGITLPLMSYGGSSILSNFMSIGLVLNIGMRRKKINF